MPILSKREDAKKLVKYLKDNVPKISEVLYSVNKEKKSISIECIRGKRRVETVAGVKKESIEVKQIENAIWTEKYGFGIYKDEMDHYGSQPENTNLTLDEVIAFFKKRFK